MSTLIANRVARLRPRAIAALFCTCLFLGVALPATAQPTVASGEWKSIQRVIAQQRAALVAGNDRKAFAYATPAIQAEFGDPTSFMAMVQTGYSALITARYVEFLEGAVIDGIVIQPLRLIDGDNIVRVALYTMEKQKNGTWRISGCRIAPSTVQAT